MAVRDVDTSLRRVEFRLRGNLAPDARRVCLCTSFNHWAPDSHEMHKGPDGDWTLVVRLPPGVYPYLYYVDGAWYNDPVDDGRMPTGWGNEYSLRVVM